MLSVVRSYSIIISLYIFLFIIDFSSQSRAFDVNLLSGRVDYTSGIDISGNNYSGYGGFSVAPLGLITEPGLRIKLNLGMGQYHYDGTKNYGAGPVPVTFTGQATTFDLMAGYSFKAYDWITKAYMGVQYNDHSITPDDPGNLVNGSVTGLKVQVETWKDLSNTAWVSGDFSYSTSYDDYWLQGRVGKEFFPKITLGLEAAVFGNENYSASRFGALGRMKTDYGDVTLSGGVSLNDDEDVEPYLSLSLYRRF